jgi:Peptidase propeptide and YPEB domain.
MANKKMIVSISVGVGVMLLTYLALQDSLNRPSLNRLPISSQTAVSIILKQENSTQNKLSDFLTNYVYIKGDGAIYESEVSSNSIGRYIDTTEPTITTGNHFAWEVINKQNQKRYYVDHITGEIISKSKF